ncbi:ArsR/SmtB family transcription factor [Pseudoduganella sp. OTU4001]|uniref:ArsR/SmtB family transcription factor n=1 Tax=Pseudoduganella sp. OTU4001 TaxID=3043854 RepID=UPI00313F1E31
MTPDPTTFSFEPMHASAAAACTLLKALANQDRLLLLCQLTQGEATVGALEEQLGIRQPTLSQQLTVLRENGLVTTRRDGKHIYYAVSSPQALAVMTVLYEQFCSNGQKEKSC